MKKDPKASPIIPDINPTNPFNRILNKFHVRIKVRDKASIDSFNASVGIIQEKAGTEGLANI